MTRCPNFSAGPAALPLEVITRLQSALPLYGETGVGLMEMSHRSRDFQAIFDSAQSKMRQLMSIPDDYEILFLQGGASLQFYMLALNLLSNEDVGNYIMTGVWSTKALVEAKRISKSEAIWSDSTCQSLPKVGSYNEHPSNVYVHYTTNNTIYGTQFHNVPNCKSHLIADMSSDICSRPLSVKSHDLIYAGAQKNLGPSGVTVVILSPWAVERSRKINTIRQGGLPSMLNYGLMVDKGSMFNTPNTFGIYALDTMFRWMESQGGLERIGEANTLKANALYGELDRTEFWKPFANKECRSQMNVTWNIQDTALESVFVKEANDHGLKALKGHRSIGGIRASLYNATNLESVNQLIDFMQAFEQKYG